MQATKASRGMKNPKIVTKFADENCESTTEHIARYMVKLEIFANDENLKMKFFPSSVTKNAFTCFSNLRPNSIVTWAQLESTFHSQSFRGKLNVTVTDLVALKRKDGESIDDFMIRLKNVRSRCCVSSRKSSSENSNYGFRDLIQEAIMEGRLKFDDRKKDMKVDSDPFDASTNFAEPFRGQYGLTFKEVIEVFIETVIHILEEERMDNQWCNGNLPIVKTRWTTFFTHIGFNKVSIRVLLDNVIGFGGLHIEYSYRVTHRKSSDSSYIEECGTNHSTGQVKIVCSLVLKIERSVNHPKMSSWCKMRKTKEFMYTLCSPSFAFYRFESLVPSEQIGSFEGDFVIVSEMFFAINKVCYENVSFNKQFFSFSIGKVKDVFLDLF
ncbi:hypothetical protein Ahy_A07g033571 [Arachis hypogaea]|uniref:Retrotransposon gag domain-containing protein n=1 Tax=Arachis hypogaea TaxID=3818 RepID=A0A445C9Q2_ARAHY|nr:hypothetical protein Ahy_A07g033571 [Arachis hypogaea]